ncbi:MAG: DNA alkylation repair protein, partial [Acholeplasmatales bacterium]|nr:DNA alkylation repair protein [Acholeplasmatales bacterium]
YHRTYFQVSLGLIKDINDKLSFIEDNFHNLNDWWHVDQLTQFIGKGLSLDIAAYKALEYINNPNPFARRWGYVMFMPTLVKQEEAFDVIISLFKNDDEYYVVMAIAWLISYLAIYYPDKTLEYLKSKPLNKNIVLKAIQKICDSYRITNEYKDKFKSLRILYK